jgi:predicted GNAT family acetyltransferase
VHEDKIVSACNSSREDNLSAESWVRTIEEYRGRGYARQVTLAWAHNLQQKGKLPFYTHKLSNIQSQKVAEGLGLMLYMEDIGYQ